MKRRMRRCCRHDRVRGLADISAQLVQRGRVDFERGVPKGGMAPCEGLSSSMHYGGIVWGPCGRVAEGAARYLLTRQAAVAAIAVRAVAHRFLMAEGKPGDIHMASATQNYGPTTVLAIRISPYSPVARSCSDPTPLLLPLRSVSRTY